MILVQIPSYGSGGKTPNAPILLILHLDSLRPVHTGNTLVVGLGGKKCFSLPREGSQAPSPSRAAHSSTQAPLPQGPGSTANLKANSSAMRFRADGKLGRKGAELRTPPHSGRLLSRGRELQSSKGILMHKCIATSHISLFLMKPDLYPYWTQLCTYFVTAAQKLHAYVSFKFKISMISTG